ncbi:MAG: serine--tRNA ligase, partial [Firmicutes bacterium]|nr:serine--tRNA ligase [Bacillota bacterium]
MLDAKFVVDNKDALQKRMGTRASLADFDKVVSLYTTRNALIGTVETKKSELNKMSAQIALLVKDKSKKSEAEKIKEQVKQGKEQIKESETQLESVAEELKNLLLSIPNVPNESVPQGMDESQNRVERVVGSVKKMGFEPVAHWDLGAKLGGLDPERAAKVTGA